jgi:hypothetical protein
MTEAALPMPLPAMLVVEIFLDNAPAILVQAAFNNT